MPEGAPSGRTTDTILAWLDAHGPATIAEVIQACGLEATSAQGRLAMLTRHGYVTSRTNGAKRPRQVYSVTAEGQRKTGISDERSTTAPRDTAAG